MDLVTTEKEGQSRCIFNNGDVVKNQAYKQTFHGPVQFFGDLHDTASTSHDPRILDEAILASLAFPQMLDRRSNVEPPHRNTCIWILELDEYKNWTAQSSGLLWIKGKPGSGKSTLMNFLYSKIKEHCRTEKGICLEFFFSARGAEMQRTPLGMVRSLLNQLFHQDVDIRSRVREVFKEKCNAFGSRRHAWEWQRWDLENLLSNAIITSAQQQPVTIFVDALDEAGEQSAREAVRYFHALSDRIDSPAITAKICISCRHYPIIARISVLEVCVEKHNGDDIASFVEDYLHLSDLGGSNSHDQEMWQDLKADLAGQAKGVFQWVHLIVPIVEKKIDDGQSPEHVRRWVRQVPPELGEVYKYILQNVIDRHDLEQSFLFFQWLCLAERPLSVKEMRFALAAKHVVVSPPRIRCHETSDFTGTDDRMKRRTRSLSGGLAEVTNEEFGQGMIVQVMHQSVKEFLLEQGLALLAFLEGRDSTTSQHLMATPCTVDVIPRCHATLYQSCLNYITTEEIPWEINGNSTTLEQYSPWIKYATINLFIHAEKAGRYRTADLREDIQLLQRIIPKWVRLYHAFDIFSEKCPSQRSTILHAAAAADLTDVIKYLLRHGADVNDDDDEGNTALHHAARWGHTKVVETLLRMKTNLEVRNRGQQTPLVRAAGHGHLSVVDLLLEHGASINESTGGSGNALQAACGGGDAKVVRILLDAGADVNAQGGKYGSALQAASYGGHENVVRSLLDTSVEVNAQGGEYGNALQAASWRGYENVVRMLVNTGANVNVQGGKYGNALHAASYEGHEKVVRMLLDNGADVNVQGGEYGSALHAASYRGHEKVVRMLLDNGANVNVQGGEYGSALQAASYVGNEKVIRMLLHIGADVNVQGGKYGNALQAASYQGYENVVRILLDTSVEVNAQGGEYGNALQAASWRGYENVVRMLVNTGANVNVQGGKYGSALQAASYVGNEKVVRMLLDTGADVNDHGGEYGSALQVASYWGQQNIVEMLLAKGADVNAQGGKYGNALQSASRRGHMKVAKLLLEQDQRLLYQAPHFEKLSETLSRFVLGGQWLYLRRRMGGPWNFMDA